MGLGFAEVETDDKSIRAGGWLTTGLETTAGLTMLIIIVGLGITGLELLIAGLGLALGLALGLGFNLSLSGIAWELATGGKL